MPTAATSPEHARALFMLVLATLFWGVSFPLIKAIGAIELALLPDAGTWFVTGSVIAPRFGFAALVLGLIGFKVLRTTTRREALQGVELGLFTGAGLVLQVDGLQYTSASTSAFLTSFYAILIPLWLALRTRRRPAALVWLSGVLVLAGVAVLARLDWHHLRLGRGELETLAGSVFFTGQILCLDRPRCAANRALPVTFAMFCVQALLGGLLALLTIPAGGHPFAPVSSGPWWALMLAITTFCTLAAFTLMNTWQPKITATEAGLIYCIEPVFASVLALFLPAWLSAWAGLGYANETASANLLLGGGLITAANILIQLNPPPKPMPTAPAKVT